MSEPVILVEKTDGVATVTLNRPQSMNALSRALREALADAIDALEADPEIRVMILTGAGRAFCAGLDLKELGAEGLSGPDNAVTTKNPAVSLSHFSGPIIGAINGVAITGGFELALACDVMIASSEARFADTHARVGIVPGWGLSQKLSRAIGIYRAKELSFTGNFMSAQQASDWGLVNRVVAPEDLLPAARALAQDMLSVEPFMLTTYKKLIDDGFGQTFADGIATEAALSKRMNAEVSADAVEARRKSVQARGQQQKG